MRKYYYCELCCCVCIVCNLYSDNKWKKNKHVRNKQKNNSVAFFSAMHQVLVCIL